VDERGELRHPFVLVVGGDVDLFDHERPISAADQTVDDLDHGVTHEGWFAALHELHQRWGFELCRHAASSTALITRTTRRALRTSWARRMRQPNAMPSECAAVVASARPSTSVPRR